MSYSPFPSLPISGISFPHSPITVAAFAYTKQHTTEAVYNHCVRSAYWALLLVKKLAPLAAKKPDLETVVLACVLHDMGWSSTKELLSTYKRFEVDGADIAREFVQGYQGEGKEEWDEARVQRVWDAIACEFSFSPPPFFFSFLWHRRYFEGLFSSRLFREEGKRGACRFHGGHYPTRTLVDWLSHPTIVHTTPSISPFGSAEVAAAHLGITADFAGPKFPSDPWGDRMKLATEPPAPGAVITVEEFREVLRAFPHAGWGAETAREIFCGLCRDKPVSTFDNFVGWFGREFGFDGKGGGKDEYLAMWTRVNSPEILTGNFAYLQGLLKEEEEQKQK
ncbi:metal dependent phosphohydrolase [Xylaria acuta]|nr:metal dependent phosphohydrolase [Xylaria acuta]